MNQDNILLTRYIAVWGWHLTGIIFLMAGLILFRLESVELFFTCIVCLIACEIMSHIRKKGLEFEGDEE